MKKIEAEIFAEKNGKDVPFKSLRLEERKKISRELHRRIAEDFAARKGLRIL